MDYLKSSLLSYLYHSLCIVDNADVIIARHFFYNLNLLDNSFTNSLELDVRTGIFIDTINIWKNLYKTALTEDPTDVDIKVSNQFDIVHHFDKLPVCQDILIPIICSLCSL